MDREIAGKLIEENLHMIFAWSMSRLYDKSEAEDLTNDIVCTVLKSIGRLENDEAFFGFMWRIAENVFRARLRKKHPEAIEFDSNNCGVYWETPEDKVIESEQLMLLRRELSLLSKQYREATVKYYIYGKTCSEISAELDISIEMVKYYLFKTRKILKEGIGMTRELGEKSYNPATFRMDYWGSGPNTEYYNMFKRRLPGNILLSAYDKPVTISELSVELGVSAVYLEDELAILEKNEVIKKIGDKYQTNIVIFTDVYEKRVVEKFKPVYTKVAESFNKTLDEILPRLKTLDFHGNTYDDNRLKWTFANIAMWGVLTKSDDMGRKRYGDYPLLSNGSYGFVFGYDNDYINHHFNGIYGHGENAERTAWVSIENYRIIQKCQCVNPADWGADWSKTFEAMNAAVLGKQADEDNENIIRMLETGVISSKNGMLSAEFPVFDAELFGGEVQELLTPMVDMVCDCMGAICDIAVETLKDYVPKALKDKCGQLAYIHHQMDVMAFIIETMVEKGELIVPDERVNLCVFGVRK